MRDVLYLNQRCPISRLKMSYILWRRLLLKTVASRQAKPPFRWPLLLPSATRMAFAICWQCAFYGSQVAEVAVFVTKKFLQNLNFRKFLPQEFWGRYRLLSRWQYSLLERDIPQMNLQLCQRESCYLPYMRYQRRSSSSATKFMLAAIPC